MILINKLKVKNYFFAESTTNIICKTFQLATVIEKKKQKTTIFHSVLNFKNKTTENETSIVLTHNKSNINLPGTDSYISPILIPLTYTKPEGKVLTEIDSLNFVLKCRQLMFWFYLKNKFISCYDYNLPLVQNSFSNRILYYSDSNIFSSNLYLKTYNKDFAKFEYKSSEDFYSEFCFNIKTLDNQPINEYFNILDNSIQNEPIDYKLLADN